jgi:putative ABC transport system ATP-binding protein
MVQERARFAREAGSSLRSAWKKEKQEQEGATLSAAVDVETSSIAGVAGEAMIVVDKLRKSLRTGSTTVEILKGIDFTIARGEFAAIMGASGSGKSTLLGLLAGLDNPTSGTVTLNGTAISYLAEDKLAQLRGRTIGFVFQSYQLIPTLTALENVLLPYELNDDGGAAANGRTVGLARARELMESVGLGARMEHYPVQLSGGEQQRVALARAFILRPPIVLADEPTGNLDTTNGEHILNLLLELNRVEKTTLVLVTHDPALAAHAGRKITLRDGMVVGDERTGFSAPYLDAGPHPDAVLGDV